MKVCFGVFIVNSASRRSDSDTSNGSPNEKPSLSLPALAFVVGSGLELELELDFAGEIEIETVGDIKTTPLSYMPMTLFPRENIPELLVT